MVFKNFRFQIVLRLIVMIVAITLFAWCIVHGLYLRSIYLAASIIILAAEFIFYADRFNRDVKTFMVSLLQRDYTTHFEATGKGKSFDELYKVLNLISASFKKISTEKEIQYRYLEMLVEHVRVGIISVDAQGQIHLANQAVKQLLGKPILPNVKALHSLDHSLIATIDEIRSGETRLVKLRVNNDLLHLSIHASEFKLEDEYYKLISMQNIRNELDAREMEAWQKLIRVLSHEIMNSVAPIISLSETLHGLVVNNKNPGVTHHQQNTLDKGLEAIKLRSEGLYNFTQSYRKLTGIPKLVLKETNVKDLVSRVQTLLQGKADELGIKLHAASVSEIIIVDPDLMEQVLINLVLNAIEAVASVSGGNVQIRASKHQKGGVCIQVIDNGDGMDEGMAEKIFIPFFTTKKNGSGIGLALTKQIIQLHNADIQFTSAKGRGTEFSIVL